MSREVMQQALEALEDYARYGVTARAKTAIPALRAALKEPEQELQWCECGDGYPPSEFDANGDCPNCQRTEPEQEPVAWKLNVDINNYQGQSEYRTVLAFRPDPAVTGNYEVNEVISAQPLYTHPPQRKPLTTMEIVNLMPSQIPADYDKHLIDFAREIERAIKQEETK